MLKKLFMSILTFFLVLNILPIKSQAVYLKNEDDFLFFSSQKYEEELKGFKEHEFTIIDDNTDDVIVNIDGIGVITVKKEETNVEKQEIILSQERFSSDEENIIASGREKVVKFLKRTKFVKDEDRQGVIEKIGKIEFQLVKSLGNSNNFDAIYEFGNVYIKEDNRKLTEWLVVHELVHGIKDYLDNKCWLETGWFVEGMTDVITASIIQNPLIANKSGYRFLQQYAYNYINIFGEKGVETFLYGTFDELNVAKPELELFIYCMNSVEAERNDSLSSFIVNNCFANWRHKA